jgi:hypothetical protein
MMVKKALLILVGMMMMVITGPVSLVMGGEPSPPGSGEKIVGPTMWAVGIVNCPAGGGISATLRVKKIEDCDVNTDPQYTILNACPEQVSHLVYYQLTPGSVFSQCPSYNPIITKVKNFKIDGDLRSFDAQINFVVPIDQLDTVCE